MEMGINALAEPVTTPGNCHRIAIAVEDLAGATRWFVDVLGATLLPVPEQAGGAVDVGADGGELTLLWLKNVPIVPLGSTDPDGNIGRFLARNGPSVQSLAWEIPDMWRTENLLRANGVDIVGTDIPGRHFFMHPRNTHGLLLEYTDDKLPGDPRLGAPMPTGHGSVAISGVAWVTAVVDDLDEVVECLRYTFDAQPTGEALVGVGAGDQAVDLRIGDMTLRLVVPAPEGSAFTRPEGATGRYHSMALVVDDLGTLAGELSAAGIRVVSRDEDSLWADPQDTLGVRLQFVAAARLDAA
jgi:catechol 2,3-dioxygenase-like lactoylglutathione lyase family enzyme